MKEILVLSGGGIKGIAHLGALKILEQNKILDNIHTYSGASIGSLICCLLNMSYSVDELYTFFKEIDLKSLSINKFKFQNLINKYGFDNGKKIKHLIHSLFSNKGYINPTFNDLYIKTKKKLYVVGTCINDKCSVYFSVDTHPSMHIITALRMSMAVPIYFAPILYDGKYYLDGSCIDNYPIKMFSGMLDKVIGIYLVSAYNKYEVSDIISFLVNTYRTLLNGIFMAYVELYKENTIQINIKDIEALEFNISKRNIKKLYKLGTTAGMEYFNHLNHPTR